MAGRPADEAPEVLIEWRGRECEAKFAAFADIVSVIWGEVGATKGRVDAEYYVDDPDLDGPLRARGFEVVEPRRSSLGPATFSVGSLRALRTVGDQSTMTAALAVGDLPDWPSTVLVGLASPGSAWHLRLAAGLDYVTLSGGTAGSRRALVARVAPELQGVPGRHGLQLEGPAD
jgi:hypothetical protein